MDPEGFSFLETLVKGSMLASALFLPDIAKANRRFEKLRVYLDTRFLLRALGLEGQGLEASCLELLQLLFELNVDLACFEITRDEIRGILDAVHHALRDPGHRARKLFGVHEHFLSIGARASDVELIIANLERSLRRIHVHVKPTPEHTTEMGLDENQLESMLQAELPVQGKDARIHDINCLTAIHRLRKGAPKNEIETSGHIFVTTNNALAFVSAKFFVEQYGRITVPLCINDHTMATLAWVKNPTLLANFSRNRLIASSYAALNPEPHLWKKYLEEINRLRQRGDLTQEDYYLLRFSNVARNALVDSTLGSPDAFTEGIVPEVLEAAKAYARRETEEKLAVEMARREEAEEKLNKPRQQIQRIAQCAGLTVKWLGYFGLSAICVWGFYETLPDTFPKIPGDWIRSLAPIAIGVFFIFTIWGITEAGAIRKLSRRLEGWTSRRFEGWLTRTLKL